MYERMLDKSTVPGFDALSRFCGDNSDSFIVLNSFLTSRFQTDTQIRFPYGSKYGWCVTHRIKKKLVCDVFAEAGAFTVMFRLSDAQYMSAYPMLDAYAREYIDSRYPCGDGGWIHYRVTCKEHLRDIETLLTLKCS